MEYRIKEICKERGILFKDLATGVGITDVGLRQIDARSIPVSLATISIVFALEWKASSRIVL